jgi:ribonuclease P protein component
VTASVPGASRPRKQQGFPRSLRLLRHADFERVYKSGRRHFSASLTVFYLARETKAFKEASQTRDFSVAKSVTPRAARPGLSAGRLRPSQNDKHSGLRIGFTVGRALGGAVQRNRMKRRLREAVRLSQPPLEAGVDVVMNPKKALLSADFEAVLNEVRRAFVVIERNSTQ